jgi:hypothetical protein
MNTQLPGVFDATKVEPAGAGTPQLPVGTHPVVITGADIVSTKDGTGGMAVFDLTVIDGPSKGATGKYRLNLFNASAQAAEIAQKQLSALCHVTGVFQVADLKNLFNIPFVIVVDHQKGDDKYTEVKGVKHMDGSDPGKGKPAATHAAPAAAAAPAAVAGAWGNGAAAAAPAAEAAPAAAAWGAGAAAPAATAPWGSR